jgi:hypothetical protein
VGARFLNGEANQAGSVADLTTLTPVSLKAALQPLAREA